MGPPLSPWQMSLSSALLAQIMLAVIWELAQMKSRTHLPLSIVFKSTWKQNSVCPPSSDICTSNVNLLEDPWLPLAGAEFAPARHSDQLRVVVLLLVRETDGAHTLTEPHRGGELDDGQVPVHAAEAEVIVIKSS